MGTEKKVIFLVLLLIVVIISCVNIHTPLLLAKHTNGVETTEEITINKEDKSQEAASTEEVIVSQEEPSTATQEVQVEVNEPENKEVQVTQDNPEDTTEKVINEKEPTEDQMEPLIKTDPRYIRENDEKPIEQLSIVTQQIQIDINNFIKDNPIVFKRASYSLNENSMKSIQMIADILKLNPNIKMEVAGHTDAAGKEKDNKEISYERARRVKNALVDLGIDEGRLIVRGYGEEIPLVKNSPNGYSMINRRVEFNIVEE
ncbi:OmpA family protein [Halarcobacter ebronensis]|uniref:OmpA-like domain-containing protein n=1 Tax=Halarcobacter ebronensis TaxID=1462615 RepID=A0A4Q1ATV5_9BACT|nr:OmpA family protein [Halarcobacter ebronensis]QKF80645.1 OmpA domain-containing protein [Halarcobacter ebronensis]RXK08446.1 hypothetical protein CRV07_01180 [Halarcobacter ebronensis]